MASPTPPSPLAGAYTRNPYPNRSPSPQQPLSKKDKKRQQYNTLNAEILADFKANREAQYRQQLVSLQTDMNLIADVDPYQPDLIPDSAEDMIRAVDQKHPYQSELSPLAGKWYGTFVQEVNQAKEAKELSMIAVVNNHEKKLQRLKEECDYKLHLAATEFEHMVNTLRERLTQQLNSKRQRLLKEKEQLDIADTNALLLHPSQFTITNPVTPAGQPPSRKTRNTRRGEQDGLNGLQEGTNKRKRKFVDDDFGSPVRNGSSTPAGRAGRANDALAMQTAPIYTINNLFTEKELNFQSHQAQVATRHFFSTSKAPANGDRPNKRPKVDGDAGQSNNATDEDDEEAEAPSMERSASQSVHVTRSRNIGGFNPLNPLESMVGKDDTRPDLPYITMHSHAPKSGTFLPSVDRLLDPVIQHDLARMNEISARPEDVLDLDEVERALAPANMTRSTLAPDWPGYSNVHLVEVDPRTVNATVKA